MAIVAIKELIRHLPPKSRLLGLDHGEKRIGLAVSDPGLTMATPLKTLARKKFTENLQELAALYREYGAGGIVIGLPLNMDGTEGPRAQSVRDFAANLLREKAVFGDEPLIVFVDERLSTYGAEQMLIEDLNMKREKRKSVIDQLAAQHILEAAFREMKK